MTSRWRQSLRLFTPWLIIATALSIAAQAEAHQLGAALIKVKAAAATQSDLNEIQIELHAPIDSNGRPPAVFAELGADCKTLNSHSEAFGDEVIRYWRGQCPNGLEGRILTVSGLNPQTPDAMLMVQYAGGRQAHFTLNRQLKRVTIPTLEQAPAAAPVRHYLTMGVEHIASGYDHLLLVLLLCLIARGAKILWLVTSFTLAHSLTLLSATLWQWQLPAQPVEAMIALSLVLLSAECLRQHNNPAYQSLTLNKPALMAFVFGLIHGLGFAGALSAVGLPDGAAWQALLLFNLGVEIGQLGFVALLLLCYQILSSTIIVQALANLKPPMLYGIGGLSAFWLWQRLF